MGQANYDLKAVFQIEEHFIDHVIPKIRDNAIREQFNLYIKYLYSEFWSLTDPFDLISDSFQKAQNDFSSFTNRIAAMLGINVATELRNPSNQIIQAAMFLETYHRILNIYGILRCTIQARSSSGRESLIILTPTLRDVINNLCDYNISITRFMNFIFRWVFLWGGIYIKIDGTYLCEFDKIAEESGLSRENVFQFSKLFYRLYQTGGSMFFHDNNKHFMKYVPAQYRALGLLHRQSISNKYSNQSLFREDSQNLLLLDQSLVNIGGHNNLSFSK